MPNQYNIAAEITLYEKYDLMAMFSLIGGRKGPNGSTLIPHSKKPLTKRGFFVVRRCLVLPQDRPTVRAVVAFSQSCIQSVA
jgi:hypothetical protein